MSFQAEGCHVVLEMLDWYLVLLTVLFVVVVLIVVAVFGYGCLKYWAAEILGYWVRFLVYI